MSGSRSKHPALPQDYFQKRLAQVCRRGDVVRRYRAIAEELLRSLMSDLQAGRKIAALVHFRALADYCLNSVFAAYPASEDELDRQSVPKNAVRAARRIIEHWEMPVDEKGVKELERTYHGLSQAAHGTISAVGSFERMSGDLLPSVEKLARMMLDWVQDADRRLNGHRAQRRLARAVQKTDPPDSSMT